MALLALLSASLLLNALLVSAQEIGECIILYYYNCYVPALVNS